MSEPRSDAGAWRWEVHEGTAAELHGRAWPDPLRRTVWDLRVTGPALVLGSTQDDAIIDRVRQAGGGVVSIIPRRMRLEDLFVESVREHSQPKAVTA